MTLFLAPGACSLAVHIAPRAISVPFEAVIAGLTRPVTADGIDHFSSSPRGCVPLLEPDDGTRQAAQDKLATRFDELDALRAEGLSK